MMRIAINGFGRIGRGVLRALYESDYRAQLQVVAINELADLATIAHLSKYDSIHGRFSGEVVAIGGEQLEIKYASYADKIHIAHQPKLQTLNWQSLNVDLLFECSGSVKREQVADFCVRHTTSKNAGVRALFSRPMLEREVDATIVYGINHTQLQAQHQFISAASCTTHAVVPVIQVLDTAFGIEYGTSTTLHSMMNDQPVLDAYHHTNLRKTRAASHSIIPINTELDKGIERVLPHLQGRFSAQAVRVPILNVSAIDLNVVLQSDVQIADVNRCLQQASQSYPRGILSYTEEPLASCDFNHCQDSAIIDASQTRVSGKRLLKVWIWFDNEWAYVHRMLDIAKHMSGLI